MAAWVRVCVYLLAVLLTAHAGTGEIQSRAIHGLRCGNYSAVSHMHETSAACYTSMFCSVAVCDSVFRMVMKYELCAVFAMDEQGISNRKL